MPLVRKIQSAVEFAHHLPRYREIAHVFFKYGFGDTLNLLALPRMLGMGPDHELRRDETVSQKEPAVRFRMALEELGPTFVKFGQLLSTRRDVVNEVFVKELEKLQDKVSPFPASEARRIIEQEMECSIPEIFRKFDDKPIASASMAQVHRGVFHNGEVVAIKTQRPDIAEIIKIDLEIMMKLAHLLEKHAENISVLNPVGIVKELSKTIWEEQDFMNEARNMDRFAKQFQGNRNIRIPRVHTEFTTRRILVMEYIIGWKVTDVDGLVRHGADPVLVSKKFSKMIFQQMFDFGFFHADPHAGNIAILEDNVICLYDYGMMGSLSPTFRDNIASLIMGLDKRDHCMVTRALLGMSEQGFAEDTRKLELDVQAFSEQYLNVSLKELRLGYVFNRLLDVLMDHKLRMLSDFYLGIKALSQVESIGVLLNPDLNFIQFGRPYAIRTIEKRYDLTILSRNLFQSGLESLKFLQEFPVEARDFYQRVKNGHFNIPLKHHIDPSGFDPMRNTFNHIANRISNSLVLSALLIFSAILFLAEHEVLGWVGLSFAIYLGLRLTFAIWKRSGF